MNDIFNYLDSIIPNPKCELEYSNDFEFLVATVLSAQTTDKKVNKVTKVLFNKYKFNELKDADIKDLENILLPLGMSNKKAYYIKEISRLLDNYEYVPNDKELLMNLPGVGNKTSNLVLSNLYNEPYFAVDTHVKRVVNRLGLVNSDNALEIEKKMYKLIPKDRINKTHHQLVLFGRYYCKSINPKCNTCKLKNICKKK